MNSNYWDEVYKKKNEKEVSWFQDVPEISLKMIDEFCLPPTANIIDIGGGDSRLVDHLLDRGFTNISVLDISSESLQKARKRLGVRAQSVEFIASDVTLFRSSKKYQLWHDRATFHFLTQIDQVEKYLENVHNALAVGGFMIVSTFSKSGPEKCSGLAVAQYSQDGLKNLFHP